MIDGMTREEHERQGEAKDNESDPQGLSRRRSSLITEFQTYIHITSEELSLASHEETDALRTPLLAMKLTEEDIGAWENFRAFLPKLLNSAQTLHAKIGHLLEQAANDHLLDTNDIAAWHIFFRSPGIGFQEKKREVEELARKLSMQKTQNTDEHPSKEKKEHRLEPNILKKDEDNEPRSEKLREHEQHPQENIPQKIPKQREADLDHKKLILLLHNTQLHTRWLLTLLPSSIAPLYTAATERGSAAVRTVHTTVQQSLLRQSLGIDHRKGTVILTREKLRNTEESLTTCATYAAQGEEAPTVILEPISLATQSVIVNGIHQTLLEDLKTLEKHGVHF